MSIDAGTLDRRIELQVATTAPDANGQPIETWSTLATVWANVRFPTGREFIAASADRASTDASFRIRARADVTPACRIAFGGKLWNIKAVLPGGLRGEYIDLPATALE